MKPKITLTKKQKKVIVREIKPRLMWGVIERNGDVFIVRNTRRQAVNSLAANLSGTTVRRVLVTEPPKRRKRHDR